MHQLPTENKPATENEPLDAEEAPSSTDDASLKNTPSAAKPFNPNDFIDIPLLIPDHEGLTDDDDDDASYRNNSNVTPSMARTATASQAISTQTSFQTLPADAASRSSVYERNTTVRLSVARNPHGIHKSHAHQLRHSKSVIRSRLASGSSRSYSAMESESSLSPLVFFQERTRLMAIIVKYIATKIENSFPPDSSGGINAADLELDKVMLLLVARLGLTLPLFLKLIIYLFRYMDIVYLLRYLNQLNNMANYQLMDFGLKQLIIGCFKLTVEMERQEEIKTGVTDIVTGMQGLAGRIYTKDWEAITGFNMTEIDVIALTISKRLNGKLTIKTMELLKLKSEIHRFVRMVSTAV